MANPKPDTRKPGQPITVAPGLKCILAPNASPMTYTGTNTYLLGTRDIAVIDPGPPDEDHLAAILDALEAHQRISHIFVTHSHIDHSPLAMVLAQVTGAKVFGFGSSSAGRAPVMASFADLGGGEGIDATFLPDVTLAHDTRVEGSDWSLTALHTPGHMGNHLCFQWHEGDAIFSGDLVMGWATSMVSPPDGHVTDFMASLEMLANRDPVATYYSGHGMPVEDPARRLEELLIHRRMRESQILSSLQSSPQTPKELTAQIYTDVSPALLPAAERNVVAHLIDLSERNQVKAEHKLTATSRFSVI
ncbi:glyoxylase-like metal-dependent hydrolase (beta-lactamase superfamily II) [Litoreibacter meonggei]|uniref:Glyoxylase-like metal-dependent hydrolase (Beta-lactamase superfamily II) n=1 Tax=Litoreibacter meonggei TaxID=1049199 RepID=A0A497VE36_9RHOB|nr:MBL fold metallo-hydrolase [Litoreibacter meonggei]RLJ41582.1 glyoxylase-like metal-dependent hydrolase (beta-lactamase superfamily II) [Litoreibacter meonggei]